MSIPIDKQAAKIFLKENPLRFIQKPKLWPSFIYVIFKAIWSRIKYSSETVYYSVVSIKKLSNLLENINKEGFKLKICNKEDSFLTMQVRKSTDFEINYLFKKRYERGDICYILIQNELPVSFLWTAVNKVTIEATGTIMDLPDFCFAIYDVYTMQEHRGKKYYNILLKLLLEHYKNRSFTSASLWVMKHNQNAIRVQNKLGFSTISKEIAYYSFLGCKRKFVTDVNYSITNLIKQN